MAPLENNAADRIWITGALLPVENDTGHRQLTGLWFRTGLKIDCKREAELILPAPGLGKS